MLTAKAIINAQNGPNTIPPIIAGTTAGEYLIGASGNNGGKRTKADNT